MKSIRSVYKVGHGPSSSHTVGPYNAAEYFKNRHKDADGFKVVLYGSLALTGAGHGTAKAINAVLPGAEILYDIKTPESELPHPNTMDFIAIKDGREMDRTRVLSVGGGAISIEGDHNEELDDVYALPFENECHIQQPPFRNQPVKEREEDRRLVRLVAERQG